MLSKKEAARLRGLIARHARCEWNMGVTMADIGEARRKSIVEDATAARTAVFAELRKLTARADDAQS